MFTEYFHEVKRKVCLNRTLHALSHSQHSYIISVEWRKKNKLCYNKKKSRTKKNAKSRKKCRTSLMSAVIEFYVSVCVYVYEIGNNEKKLPTNCRTKVFSLSLNVKIAYRNLVLLFAISFLCLFYSFFLVISAGFFFYFLPRWFSHGDLDSQPSVSVQCVSLKRLSTLFVFR